MAPNKAALKKAAGISLPVSSVSPVSSKKITHPSSLAGKATATNGIRSTTAAANATTTTAGLKNQSKSIAATKSSSANIEEGETKKKMKKEQVLKKAAPSSSSSSASGSQAAAAAGALSSASVSKPQPLSKSHSPLDHSLVEKAVKALITHIKKVQAEKPTMFDNTDDFIWLQMGLKRMPDVVKRMIRIPLAHPIYEEDNVEICLFTKDTQREHKDLLAKKGVKNISRVLGVSKLRAKFKPYEAKRELCSRYDLFLADDRIVPLLPRLLGKSFFERKRVPIPINLKKSNLQDEFKKVLSSSHFTIGHGSSSSIKVARVGFKQSHIVENIIKAAETIAQHVAGKWKGIQALHIRTSESIALPIYNSLPLGEADQMMDLDGPMSRSGKSGEKDTSDFDDTAVIDDDEYVKAIEEELALEKSNSSTSSSSNSQKSNKHKKSQNGNADPRNKGKIKVDRDSEDIEDDRQDKVDKLSLKQPLQAKKPSKVAARVGENVVNGQQETKPNNISPKKMQLSSANTPLSTPAKFQTGKSSAQTPVKDLGASSSAKVVASSVVKTPLKGIVSSDSAKVLKQKQNDSMDSDVTPAKVDKKTPLKTPAKAAVKEAVMDVDSPKHTPKVPIASKSSSNTPGAKTPASKASEVKATSAATPIAKTPATKTPASKASESKAAVKETAMDVESPKQIPKVPKSSSNTPVAKTPASKVSEVKAASAATPIVKTPATKTPSSKVADVKAPATATPIEKTPSAKTLAAKVSSESTPATTKTPSATAAGQKSQSNNADKKAQVATPTPSKLKGTKSAPTTPLAATKITVKSPKTSKK